VYDLYALMDPAREVGGDFYDFFPLDEDHLCLVIGDVSDKGIPAALFMMTSKTMLKAHAMSSRDPAETLTAVNRTLCEYNPAEMFVTVWMGILDLKTGLLTASNGGHEYPMFQLGEKPFEVMEDPHGLVLGAMPAAKYRNYEVQMNPGDRLFVYSDGATDAVNTETKDFGLTRLHETVVKAAECSDVQGLITAVRKQLDDYSRGADQFDDITLLTLNYYGQKELQKGSETI
jgi:serine phosphatase RsbU (regulator of sigma subunit)